MEETMNHRGFKINYTIFTYFGFWPRGFEENYKRWLFSLFETAQMFSMSLFDVLGFIDLYQARHDIHRFTYNMCLTLTSSITTLKSINIQHHAPELDILRKSMNNNFYLPHIGDAEDVRFVNRSSREALLIARALYSFGTPTVFLWMLIPAVDKNAICPLPFCTWTPVEMEVSPYHEILYFWHNICGFTLLVMVTCCSLIYYTSLLQLGGQYDILEKNLLASGKKYEEESEILLREECEQIFHAAMSENIKHHQCIARAILKIEDIFNFPVLLHLLGAALLLCVTAFDILSGDFELSTRVFTQLFYICAVLLDVACYCYFGTRLEMKSSNIVTAAYSTPWYFMTIPNRKLVLTMMIKAQSPPKVTAGKLYLINLSTYLDLLSMSYNSLAILLNISN